MAHACKCKVVYMASYTQKDLKRPASQARCSSVRISAV